MSAESGASNTIFEDEFNTRQTVCANPKIVITARAFPKLKLSPTAFGSSMQRIKQSTKSSTKHQALI